MSSIWATSMKTVGTKIGTSLWTTVRKTVGAIIDRNYLLFSHDGLSLSSPLPSISFFPLFLFVFHVLNECVKRKMPRTIWVANNCLEDLYKTIKSYHSLLKKFYSLLSISFCFLVANLLERGVRNKFWNIYLARFYRQENKATTDSLHFFKVTMKPEKRSRSGQSYVPKFPTNLSTHIKIMTCLSFALFTQNNWNAVCRIT